MGVVVGFQAERGRSTSEPGEAIRLSMKPPGTGGVVDGGWWPRSRDTMAELPDLVTALHEPLGTVSMIALAGDDWIPGPHRVGVDDQVVAVSRSDRRPAHTILVVGRDRRQATLLVVPPEMPAAVGAAALRIAGDERDTSSPAQILAQGWLAGQGPRPVR